MTTKPFVFPADPLVRINAAREAALAAGVAAARAAGRNPNSVRIDIVKEVLAAVPDASVEEIAASLIWDRLKQKRRRSRKRQRHQTAIPPPQNQREVSKGEEPRPPSRS
jgi:hypothetical protein